MQSFENGYIKGYAFKFYSLQTGKENAYGALKRERELTFKPQLKGKEKRQMIKRLTLWSIELIFLYWVITTGISYYQIMKNEVDSMQYRIESVFKG